MTTMAPIGPRPAARQRAADAYRLRCTGRTFDQIATEIGYGSPAAAYNAIRKHIERMPAEDQALSRAFSAGNYRQVIAALYDLADRCKTLGRTTGEVQALEAIANVQDRHDKLQGLHIAVPTEVNVNVKSSVEMLTATRTRLLEDIDAEIVELPGSEPRAVEA